MTILLDTSGSMVQHMTPLVQIGGLLQDLGFGPVYSLNWSSDDSNIELLSDGENSIVVSTDDFTGDTKIGDALDELSNEVNDRIILITDGVVTDTDNFITNFKSLTPEGFIVKLDRVDAPALLAIGEHQYTKISL